MKILFLIGNGFDLNLGMKTRYRDFYKYYRSQKSSSPLIQKLKDDIDENLENWSDLELELGRYTENLKTSDEFIEVFEDLEDRLAEYLEKEESGFNFDQLNRKKLYKDLIYPENYLPPTDKNKLKEFRKQWRSAQWNINIITFNYTKTLETLTDFSGSQIKLNEYIKHNNYTVVLNQIEHVHGFTNDRMIMGVNDISQVSNKSFHDDHIVRESLIKSDCYIAQKQNTQNWCRDRISDANLICVFGSSIGNSDNLWWERIGERLKQNCILIIFEKGESIPKIRPQKGLIPEREKIAYFLSKTQLSEEENEEISQKIFININSNMLKL